MDATTQATLTKEIAALPAGIDDFAAFQQLVKQPSGQDVRTVLFAFRNPYFADVLAALQKIPEAQLTQMSTAALYTAVVPNAISFADFRTVFQAATAAKASAGASQPSAPTAALQNK